MPFVSSKETPKRKRISSITRQKVAAKQQWLCNLCSLMLKETFQIDHIIPLSKGGLEDISNYQALCPNCHAEKTSSENEVRLDEHMNRKKYIQNWDLSSDCLHLSSYDCLEFAKNFIFKTYRRHLLFRMEFVTNNIHQKTTWSQAKHVLLSCVTVPNETNLLQSRILLQVVVGKLNKRSH